MQGPTARERLRRSAAVTREHNFDGQGLSACPKTCSSPMVRWLVRRQGLQSGVDEFGVRGCAYIQWATVQPRTAVWRVLHARCHSLSDQAVKMASARSSWSSANLLLCVHACRAPPDTRSPPRTCRTLDYLVMPLQTRTRTLTSALHVAIGGQVFPHALALQDSHKAPTIGHERISGVSTVGHSNQPINSYGI